MDMFPVKFDTRNLNFLGLALAAIVGLLLNVALWGLFAAVFAFSFHYGWHFKF